MLSDRELKVQNGIFEYRFLGIQDAFIKLNSGIETIKQLIMSPILPASEDQKSVGSVDQNTDMGNIFPNNVENEVNLSSRDNEAAVLSIRSKNIALRQKDERSKTSKNERRESAMIRNLDRLISEQDSNIRVYK